MFCHEQIPQNNQKTKSVYLYFSVIIPLSVEHNTQKHKTIREYDDALNQTGAKLPKQISFVFSKLMAQKSSKLLQTCMKSDLLFFLRSFAQNFCSIIHCYVSVENNTCWEVEFSFLFFCKQSIKQLWYCTKRYLQTNINRFYNQYRYTTVFFLHKYNCSQG